MKPSKAYEAPTIVVLGRLASLTQVIKKFNASDGLTFMGTSIGNASV